MKADFFYERSFSDVYGDDDAFGAHFSTPNEPFSMRAQFKQIGENFNPALGFVNRTGIRFYDGNFVYRYRPNDDSGIRWYETGTWYSFVTDLDGVLGSRENGWWGGFMNQETDNAFINLWNDYENVTEAFYLPRGVLVPVGHYTWSAGNLQAESSIGRPVSGHVEIECCDFFDGHILRTYVNVTWRPDSTWDIGATHQFYNITLPTGDVEIQIYALNLTLNFTPDMQLSTQVQYDNISRGFGLSSRYRWEFSPGSEFFVALGESGELFNGSHYRSSTTQASVRVGHLMRF